MEYRVTAVCLTTDGASTATSEPMPLLDAMDNTMGLIAAVGEENVISIYIGRAG